MIDTNKTNCILCENDNYKFLFHAQDEEHGIEGTFAYVRCKKCGLVYMNPQIANEELAKYYPTNYLPHETVNSPTSKQEKPNGKIISAIKTFFFQHDNINKIPNSIMENLNSKSKVLDVGCGNGTFMNDIRNKTKCHVDGIDFSETAVTAAKKSYGLNIINGTIEDLPFSPKSFDLITAWWFLVHVNNPNEVLQSLAKSLKDDGDCIIGVPNFNSFNARYFKEKWFHIDAPKHLCIHTPSTIKTMLENNSFRVEKIIYDNNPSGFFASLNNRYRIKKNKIPSFLIKVIFIFIAITSLFKVSDLMIIHAKKLKNED